MRIADWSGATALYLFNESVRVNIRREPNIIRFKRD